MCVIAVCATNVRPTKEQVEQMWDSNPHGGGVAWREGQGENRVVRWDKGLSLEEMITRCAELPFPYIAHFRIPSSGPDIRELCHPFPIDLDSPSKLEGETREGVMFHNGTWNGWMNELKLATIHGGWTLPKGRYSDSRAMAIMTAHMGPGILEIIGEKVCLMTPSRLDSFGGPWHADGGILYSNLGWKSSRRSASSSGSFRGDERNVGSTGGGGSTGSSDKGNSYHTTPPASMAGSGPMKRQSGDLTPDDPFGETPTRKMLRRLRRKQERHSIQKGITTPLMIPMPTPSST